MSFNRKKKKTKTTKTTEQLDKKEETGKVGVKPVRFLFPFAFIFSPFIIEILLRKVFMFTSGNSMFLPH